MTAYVQGARTSGAHSHSDGSSPADDRGVEASLDRIDDRCGALGGEDRRIVVDVLERRDPDLRRQ